MNFAIFRVEGKLKSINAIRGFAKHMMRETETLNANRNIENKILIGDGNIVKNTEKYIKGIKLRKNAVIGRDLLLTCSPEWMEKASPELKQKWESDNVAWLKKEFGDNIVFGILHRDEKTLHISALLIPKFPDAKKGHILSNTRYFDGATKLSKWQDNYSDAMKEIGLERGIRHSKALHTDIKLFYGMVNAEIKENDLDNLCAKATNNILLKAKVNQLRLTLGAYKGYNLKTEQEKEETKKQNIILSKQIKDIKKDKELYKDCIKVMSNHYHIPQNHIENILNSVVKQQSKESELEK